MKAEICLEGDGMNVLVVWFSKGLELSEVEGSVRICVALGIKDIRG